MTERSAVEVMFQIIDHLIKAKDYGGAAKVAGMAAPYVHGKVPLARPGGNLAGVPDDELEDWFGGEGAAVAPSDTKESG